MLQGYLRWRMKTLAQGIAFAVLVTVIATMVRALLGLIAPDAVPFATFLLAVLVTTFVAGWEGGVFSLLLGAVVATYLFVEPQYALELTSPGTKVSVCLFLATGAVIIFVMHALRSAFDRELASEERLSRAQEDGNLGDWDWDLVNGEVTWSRNLYRLLERDPETFTPSPEIMKSLLHPDDRIPFAKTIASSVASGNRIAVEKRVLFPDGAVRHFVSRGEVIRNPNGRAIRLRMTDIDITNRRHAELALATSEERYRTLFSAMSEAYVVHELIYDGHGNAIDFRALEANPAFERTTGMALESVVGKLASEFAPGGDPAWLTLFADVVRAGMPARMERYSARPKRWIDLRAFPLGGPRVGAVFLDVTERKEADVARQVAEVRLAAAMHIAKIGVYSRDLTTDVVAASASCDAIFGFEEHLPSRPLSDYIDRIEPEDVPLMQERIEVAVAARSDYEIEYRVRRSDGVSRWISSKGAVIADETGLARVVGAIFDITSRKRLELEQEQARERAEHMFREMNHRIKNNLAIVGSLLTMQASRTTNPDLSRSLTAARERVQTIADLHESLYQGTELGEVDFAGHLTNICERIRSSLATTVPVQWTVEAEPTIVTADIAVPLGLIVNELATNAVKHAFTQWKEPTDCRITVTVSRSDGRIILTIADNGCGLPKGWPLGGNGLGSRLIDAFVNQVGGAMTVSSEKGTRFEIVLPEMQMANAA